VACCTRNRPHELDRLVVSVIQARALAQDLPLEFLVIDDGALGDDLRRSLEDRLDAARVSWRYHNKRGKAGLLQSRIEAVELAAHDWILFVDDDVEVARDYLAQLKSTITARPNLSGIGGVDDLLTRRSTWRLALCLLLGLEPLRLGRLSYAGFPSSMGRLVKAKRAFFSERVYGCNMAFRRAAIADLHMLPGFEGYSLGEDAYLSFFASGSGRLLIDPGLAVKHRRSSAARDSGFDVGRMSIANHILLMRRYGRPRWRMASLLISLPALVVICAAKGLWDYARRGDRTGLTFARGQFFAIGKLLRDSVSEAKPRRSPP
jgi:glycosyltransferase involved in cell wall biosynthesis